MPTRKQALAKVVWNCIQRAKRASNRTAAAVALSCVLSPHQGVPCYRRSMPSPAASRRLGSSKVKTFARTLRHFPFTARAMGTLSMRLRDFTMSFVAAAYFLKCAVSRCALNASASV